LNQISRAPLLWHFPHKAQNLLPDHPMWRPEEKDYLAVLLCPFDDFVLLEHK
jgi:hypothetical protein